MKDIFKTNFYLICAVIFQTLSTLSIKLFLNIFKNSKRHPYIITCIYFITYLLFSIKYFYEIPHKAPPSKVDTKENNNIISTSINEEEDEKPRQRRQSINLYKRRNIITINSKKKNDSLPDDNSIKKNCGTIKHSYCWKREIFFPSLLLGIGYGINIYTLGKINIILYQVMQSCVIICQFKILKTKEIYNINPQKVAGSIIVVMSVLGFLIYHLIKSDYEISYLFFVLFNFLSDIGIGFGKFYNYYTIERHSLNFIILTRRSFKEKEGRLYGDDEEEEEENESEDINKNIKEKKNNDSDLNTDDIEEDEYEYYCYERIVFYEGILCFFSWLLLVVSLSFVKCPSIPIASSSPSSYSNNNNNNTFINNFYLTIIKEFVCNNCTTVSGYESFFDNYEMTIIDNFKSEKKNETFQKILKFPIFSILFIIIFVVSEFFNHVSFQNVFYGKYKTKCILMLTPIVAGILWVATYYIKKMSLKENNFFYHLQLETINLSEIVSCGFMILGTFVAYIKIL